MRYLVHLAAIIFLLSLQLGLLAHFPAFGGLPNLLLVWVIICAFLLKSEELFFICAAAGLFLDFYAPAFAGTFVLVFLLVGLTAYLLLRQIFVFAVNKKSLFLGTILGTLLTGTLVWLYFKAVFYMGWWPVSLPDGKRFWIQLLLQTGYNLALTIPLYWLAVFLQNVFYRLKLK